MDVKELRKKSPAELQQSVRELHKKLSDFRQTLAANRLKNPREISNTKKEIARILTVLNEKKLP